MTYKKVYEDPTIGSKFGRWTVTGPTEKSLNNNNRRCLCRCECGTERSVLIRCLYSGHSKGCRCINEGKRLRPYEALYRILCRQAKIRGHTVELSFEDYLQFTKILHCHYCKSLLKWVPFDVIKNNGSCHNLDRVDNDKGYTRDNCVACCARCNRAKSNHFTYDEWKSIGRLIQTWEK